jgi:hypothetical protein
MPETSTVKRARRDLQEGKSASTAAGEFVHEEIEHVRTGVHGARSARQAIAIGLSKARHAGIPLPAPGEAQSPQTRQAARSDAEAGKRAKGTGTPPAGSQKRKRAAKAALAREGHRAASHQALSAQAKRGRRR